MRGTPRSVQTCPYSVSVSCRVVGGQIFLLRNELLFGPFLLSPMRSSPDGVSTAKRADLGYDQAQ